MGKYKYAITARIRQYVEWQLEHYNDDVRQLKSLKTDMIPSPTQAIAPTGKITNGTKRQSMVEDTAIKIATNPYIQQLERSCAVIGRVLDGLDEIDAQLVELVYWRGTHTPEGAGQRLGLSKAAVYLHLNAILGKIATEMGYTNI